MTIDEAGWFVIHIDMKLFSMIGTCGTQLSSGLRSEFPGAPLRTDKHDCDGRHCTVCLRSAGERMRKREMSSRKNTCAH
jgi:hypothetical protein